MLVELQLDGDPLAPHDDQRILDISIDVEVQGHLVGVVGRRERLDSLYCKHAHVFAPMTVAYEIEAAVHVAQAVGIHFPAIRHVPTGGEIAHLDRVSMGDGL